METAVVTNIQGYSIHDGPGIRTVVFLKGCPLRCRWCANPENINAGVELGFIKGLCHSCGRCVRACNHKAIKPGDDIYRIDHSSCVKCFRCVDTCYFGAIVRYGGIMTSREVYEKTRRDKMFYDSSGGGVTFSGGEPLLRANFVAEVAESLRADGVSVCVETCGAVGWDAFEAVLPFIDAVYFDLKLMDNQRHLEYTGAENVNILQNAERLARGGVKTLFRKPLIPGVNDGDAETEATVGFLLSIGAPKLELMPYHRIGLPKYEALGAGCGFASPPAHVAEVEAVRGRYTQMGVDCSVSK